MNTTSTLQTVSERGVWMGFNNLFNAANASWWCTKKWLIQSLIWLVALDGMLALFIWRMPAELITKSAADYANIKMLEEANTDPIAISITVYLVFCGLATSIAAILAGQEAFIGERASGTAAWILSKPVSRPAFILSRLLATAIGLLVTGVLVQGAAAYTQLSFRVGYPWTIPGFLGAMGLVFLNCLFYLTLTYMLGSFFTSRGPVLGISLAAAIAGPTLLRMVPVLKEITPWSFFQNVSVEVPVGMAAALGQPPSSWLAIICTALMCVVFTVISILRFQREEF